LHLSNIWNREDELNGWKKIFQILRENASHIGFTLTCHTCRLQLDFIPSTSQNNESQIALRFGEWQIYENADMKLIENFLQNISIHTLSLQLIDINSKAFYETLANAIDQNETLEILELKGSGCSANFHRKKQVPVSEISERRSRNKVKRLLAFLSCRDNEHRRESHEEISHWQRVPRENKNQNYVSAVSFDTLCKHPPLCKQIQESSQHLQLKELQVTVRGDIEMRNIVLSMKSNLTVTQLKLSARILRENDVQLLVKAFCYNKKITHLSLNEIKISPTDVHKIFVALYDDKVLRVLDLSQCRIMFDRGWLKQEVETLALHNSHLKIMYENQ
jgi:hypothetical protein